MKLYEIDEKMDALIDSDTGELLDVDAYMALQMERDAKIEATVRWYKNEISDALALRAEIESLKEREDAVLKRARRLESFVEYALNGQPFFSACGEVSYRKSSAVEVGDEFVAWAQAHRDDLLRLPEPPEPMPDKKAIKAAIQAGEELPHAQLIERLNMRIK